MIRIAILVNRAVLLEITMPALGFIFASVLELIVDANPIKFLLIINKIFFLFKLLYFFL